MAGISELVKKYPQDILQKEECFYHPGTSALGICSRCGRDLCYDCFLNYERSGFCPQCRHHFLSPILRLRPYLFNPVAILLLAIGFFSILYVTAGRGKINLIKKPSWETGLAKEDIALRNWLYLGKATRLKLYADHLKKTDRANLAKRSYHRARLALEEVLQETQKEVDTSIADAKAPDKSVVECLAQLLISSAACYRGEQEISSAIRTLNKSLEVNPGAETAGLAYHNLGRIYEEEIKDYNKAISMYKAAQGTALQPRHLFENMLAFLEKPVSEKRIAGALRQLAGRYDPAEAQFRVIGCYEKLGMKDKITEECNVLIGEYPFSRWAIEAGEKVETEEVKKEPEIKKEKESIKIVPLEE